MHALVITGAVTSTALISKSAGSVLYAWVLATKATREGRAVSIEIKTHRFLTKVHIEIGPKAEQEEQKLPET